MTQEALKLALEALEEAWYHVGTFQPTEKAIDLYDEARTAIKEALREHAMREVQRLGQEIEQEPVKYSDYEPDGVHHNKPPQRTWVGLTDEEIKNLCLSVGTEPIEVRLIEAKLKEKNT
jgi:hypothetical protein